MGITKHFDKKHSVVYGSLSYSTPRRISSPKKQPHHPHKQLNTLSKHCKVTPNNFTPRYRTLTISANTKESIPENCVRDRED
ncbi:hypothetical protein YC2023_037880 [Brassica napus]